MPIVRLLLITALLAAPLLAHEGEPLAPHDLWRAWTFSDYGITIPLLVTAVLYALGARASRGFRRWEQVCFWCGWATLAVALVSPIHPLGEVLFSAHMVQHEIIMTISAPLLVLGRPLVAFFWSLPLNWRRRLGGFAFRNLLAAPVAAWLIHAVVLWVWHIPSVFDLTLESDLIHSLQHISFLVAAVLFWWSLVAARSGGAILSLFTTAIHTVLLGALITLAPVPLYTAYAPRTAAWGLTPLEDQQLAGLIMWVPAGIVYVAAALILLYQWLRRSDRAVIVAASLLLLAGCSGKQDVNSIAARLSGGHPEQGAAKVRYYGCGGCHTIPGIPGANALVGPPLTGIANRVYIAGVLPNTPDNLIRWVQHPRRIDEKTAMPDLNVTAQDARDITAYLMTLR